MHAARKNIIQEVQAKVDAGLTFDRVHELIKHPSESVGWGEYLEGQEQEPLLGEGEAAWVNDAENMDAQAAKDLEFQLLCLEDVGDVSGDIVLKQPGDDPDDSSTAVADVRGAASTAKLPWRAQGGRPSPSPTVRIRQACHSDMYFCSCSHGSPPEAELAYLSEGMSSLALSPSGAGGLDFARDLLTRMQEFQGIQRLGRRLKSPRLSEAAARELHSIQRQLRATTHPETGKEIQVLHREINRKMAAERRQDEIRRKRRSLLEARSLLRKRWIKSIAPPKPAQAASSKKDVAGVAAPSAHAKLAQAASSGPKETILVDRDFGHASNPLLPKFAKNRERVMLALVDACPHSPWHERFGPDVIDFAPWWPHFVKWYAVGDSICMGRQQRKTGQGFCKLIKDVHKVIAHQGTEGFIKFVKCWIKLYEPHKPDSFVREIQPTKKKKPA